MPRFRQNAKFSVYSQQYKALLRNINTSLNIYRIFKLHSYLYNKRGVWLFQSEFMITNTIRNGYSRIQ